MKQPMLAQAPAARHAVCTTLLAAGCAALALTPLFSAAQTYPAKPIRLIVPFPPGGANDIASRTLNTRLPALLGQNLIIYNRPGAGGNIGAELKKDFALWDKLIRDQGLKLE